MIISSRQTPAMYIRRSQQNPSNMPPSISSSKKGFKHLLVTPPPSPRLPSMIPRHGKPTPGHRCRASIRLLLWLCGVCIIVWFAISRLRLERQPAPVSFTSHDGQEYEIVGDDALPDYPAPVAVTDGRGRTRWTVSIPPNRHFPLRPKEYADICHQAQEVAAHVADVKSGSAAHDGHSDHAGHFGYYHYDRNFMDIAEAEENGLLPGLGGKNEHRVTSLWEKMIGLNAPSSTHPAEDRMCKKSLTYVLETADAGLGNTLMGLWMAYGLAKKERRAFFIDDTNWAYGKYNTYFKPPPAETCLAPPRTWILPCPHHAHHLVVSAATTSWTFGHNFNEEFEDPRKMEVMRLHKIFALIEHGYRDLFHLRDDDNAYAAKRKAAILAKTTTDGKPGSPRKGLVIGTHVRHGDKHPLEFQYQKSYIPLERYVDVAREILQTTFKPQNSTEFDKDEDMMAEMKSILILASDDPDVYTSPELSFAVRAQDRIILANKEALTRAGQANSHKFIDQTIGWEGGFFRDLFWSLGGATKPLYSVHDTSEDGELIPPANKPTPPEALRLRELIGRAYLLDLKVLGESSDKIICGTSAMGCRLLAVMMGWDSAIVKGNWRNIDGDFDWTGLNW